MGRFKQFLGKTEIEIAGQKIELDATVNDMQKIMNLKDFKTDQLEQTHKVIMDMMKKSYPDEPVDELESFVTKNVASFLPELAIAWKWTTRDDFERTLKTSKKVVGQTPEKVD